MDTETEFSSSHPLPRRHWKCCKRKPGQSPRDQSFVWDRTSGPEAHGTRALHGSEILLLIGGEPRHHQSAPSGSQFELAILETLAKIGELLESLTPRVEGSDSSGLTPSGVSQTSGFSRDCHGVAGMSTNGWKTDMARQEFNGETLCTTTR